MKGSQPKLHVALRIAAGIAVVCWLGVLVLCNAERAFGWDACASEDHAGTSAAQAVAAHHQHQDANDADGGGEAHHTHDAEGHSHGSHHHDGGEGSCCSTLKAITQTPTPIVLGKPALHPLTFLCVLLEARNLSLLAPETVPGRQTKRCEWVFTPEVCTGSANRSHAPPVFI